VSDVTSCDRSRILSHIEKISVTLREDQVGQLSGLVGEKYDDRSKAVRDLLDRGFSYEDLQRELEQTEARVEDLRRQLQQANSRQDDVTELVEYVEEERAVQQRREERRSAPVWTRARRWLFGYDEKGETAD
jgi:SOS response regulatory protein OraA/RecX